MDTIENVDKKLLKYYQRKSEEEGIEIGSNVIKAVSEAILFATATCYEKVDIFKGIRDNLIKTPTS